MLPIFRIWARFVTFGNDLSGGLIKKTNPILILKLLPPETTNDIPIIISYITRPQHLKVTSDMQTPIWLDFCLQY